MCRRFLVADIYITPVLIQSCALGYYSFGHEMAHGFGLAHDRKATSSSSTDYAFGYIIQVRYGAYPPLRARICKPFKEPRNRFLAWRANTTTLFDVLARQAT
jgi:hypothetical protein